jgi:hypothetical protein
MKYLKVPTETFQQFKTTETPQIKYSIVAVYNPKQNQWLGGGVIVVKMLQHETHFW